jgi:hypothetical protein
MYSLILGPEVKPRYDRERLMGLLNTLKFIVQHPLNADGKFRALARFAVWQIAGRMVPGPVIVDFVAAGAPNTRCVAFEPAPLAFDRLRLTPNTRSDHSLVAGQEN